MTWVLFTTLSLTVVCGTCSPFLYLVVCVCLSLSCNMSRPPYKQVHLRICHFSCMCFTNLKSKHLFFLKTNFVVQKLNPWHIILTNVPSMLKFPHSLGLITSLGKNGAPIFLTCTVSNVYTNSDHWWSNVNYSFLSYI